MEETTKGIGGEEYKIIENFYTCSICGTGHARPLGEVKIRRIRPCKQCGKMVKMRIPENADFF